MASSEKIDQSLPASANSAVMSAFRYFLLLFLLSVREEEAIFVSWW
jgi:hypothetical protein